ncbi:SDR family oxidoreductase [Kineosporia sp. NBRC 101731]|uniref:SDR family oxidoreductase n=1 Tax=Kineosporia sp. NBRC 101731 TaxID=3032199 RepID=UPI0024A4823F|nr:SDR family oxidoreductase [Kineosporia sp. NBRC 101731]GLY27387.1 short-chain dehydrogenase [Kineosporia sp. NBRC 101731]
MKIAGSVALVTGANRGLGRALAAHLVERGASKVYATARTASSVDLPGVEVLQLDITDPESVAAAAKVAHDVTLLVNNAGVLTGARLLDERLDLVRQELDVHFWGNLNMVRAFAPALAANGGGAIVNMLSALSWFSYPGSSGYAVGKSAAWAMTNSLRIELFEQGTQVTGVHLGAADTDMMAGYEGPMVSPAQVAAAALDGVEAGLGEVLVDDWTRYVKASLAHDPNAFYTPAFIRGELPA